MMVLLLCMCPFTGIESLLKTFSKLTEKYVSGLKLKSENALIFLAMCVVSL